MRAHGTRYGRRNQCAATPTLTAARVASSPPVRREDPHGPVGDTGCARLSTRYTPPPNSGPLPWRRGRTVAAIALVLALLPAVQMYGQRYQSARLINAALTIYHRAAIVQTVAPCRPAGRIASFRPRRRTTCGLRHWLLYRKRADSPRRLRPPAGCLRLALADNARYRQLWPSPRGPRHSSR